MKTLFAVVLALLPFVASAFSQSASQAEDKTQASKKHETPFYCNRTAINAEQRKRKAELDQALFSTNAKIGELEDGFVFEFPGDPAIFQKMAEWAAMERACCPFFDIGLRLEREGGPFSLRLTGREGVKQFIEAEFPQVRKELAAQGECQ